MTQEEKARAYDEALNEIRELISLLKKNDVITDDGIIESNLQRIFPQLKENENESESEDERIVKKLIWQVNMNIEDETSDLERSVYDGIKGHDPDLEDSIEDWKKCLAWLEKQKEQKPVEWSEEDEYRIRQIERIAYDAGCTQRLQEEIHDWLKSLRPSWKPSEEQMEALLWCTAHLGGADHRVLAELYEHLKKFKED